MPALTVAFYGKIASQADFVRINAGAFQKAGWDAWFQEGMADLQRRGLSLPREPVGFVLDTLRERVFAGAFAPGQDALSRSFPSIVSIETPAPSTEGLVSWRRHLESFFASAGCLATRASQLTTTELATRLQALGALLDATPCPTQPDALACSSLAELTKREALADLAYGLTTAIAACAEARASKPGLPSRGLTHHAENATEVQRDFWIELVCRHLGQTLPSLLWTGQNLLIALGPPPAAALASLAAPGHGGSRFWPLHTSHPTARASAIAQLSPAQAHVLGSPGASLAHVLSVFSREPQ
jgi:type VI secretion system ImpM family protein